MGKLPLETTFNEFVVSTGGELIEKILPNNNGRKRADYLFRSPPVVAELKCLEHEINMADYVRKLQARVNDWSRRGLVRGYGRVQLDIRELPRRCQDEWLELHERPIQKHVLADANKQIREAKESLGLPDARGVVLIANEGQFISSPADLMTYAARILKKRKPDGQLIYSSIQYVVVFAVNTRIASPEFPKGMVSWFAGRREQGAEEPWTEFLNELGESWIRFCTEKMGSTYSRRRLDLEQIKSMRFVPPTSP